METVSTRSRFARWLATTGIGILLAALVVMWIIEIVDTVALDDRLQGGGIHPRRVDGLDGILWAPFLQSGFRHLFSNSAPLIVLGGLVAARGFAYWRTTTIIAVLLGGALTWVLAGSGNHIGASGVIFAYFGALIGAAVFERRARALGGALIAIFLYGGLAAGIVPQPQLSWEGHLFGLVAGLVAARWLAEERPPKPGTGSDEPRYSWELDEPWLD